VKKIHNKGGVEMDSIKVRLFLLVEKYKSFSAVADEFSYTPSAISHMADSLEEEMGITLFDRTNKGVTLTEEGKILYDKFLSLATLEEELIKAAENLKEKNRHTLRIGSYSSIALHFLPEILQSVKTEFPNVKPVIMVDDYMHDWIEKDMADVILADQLIKSDMWQPLWEDEYVAVVPSDDFASQETIDVDELYDHTFIKPVEENLVNYLDYNRFSDIIEVNSIENTSLIFMVREKLGLTIISGMSINTLPHGVKALKLTPAIKRTIGIIYDTKHASPACKNFVCHIKNSSDDYHKTKLKL